MSLHIFMAFVCVGVFFARLRSCVKNLYFTVGGCISVCVPGAWRVWPVLGAASGTQTTTPAATWMKPRAPTSLGTGRLVFAVSLISDGIH